MAPWTAASVPLPPPQSLSKSPPSTKYYGGHTVASPSQPQPLPSSLLPHTELTLGEQFGPHRLILPKWALVTSPLSGLPRLLTCINTIKEQRGQTDSASAEL